MFELGLQCSLHSMKHAQPRLTRYGAPSSMWNYICAIFGVLCLLQLPVAVDGSFANCTVDSYKVNGIKYENITCSGLGLTEVPSDGKNGADITKLDLSNNQISSISQTNFQYFINLVDLDLSNNQISSIPSDAFSNLTSLQILNLGANKELVSLPSGLFDATQLITLSLSGNTNFRQKNVTAFGGQIYALDISHLSLTEFPSSAINSINGLVELDVSYNNITSLSSNAFTLNSLKRVILRGNQITRIGEDLFNSRSLKELDLSHNSITTIDEDAFDNGDALTNLNISHNLLRRINSELFENIQNLEVLDLSNNQLTTLSGGLFEDARSITNLNLQDNQLTGLPSNIFKGLNSMNSVDLSENRLTYLSDNIFDSFGSFSLDISNNAFNPCDCDFRNVLYGVSRNGQLLNQDTTTCIKDNTSHVYLDYYENTNCDGNLGSVCTTEQDCMVQHVSCTNNACACQTHYYDDNGVLVPAGLCKPKVSLDYPCDMDDACETTNSECTGSPTERCLCIAGYYDDSPLYLGGNCHLKLDLGGSCTFNTMCGSTNAECGTGGTCVCQSDYYDNNTDITAGGECLPKLPLHSVCNFTDQCAPSNSECNVNCTCKTGFWEINNSGLCEGPSSFYSCYPSNTSSVNIVFEHSESKSSDTECEEYCFSNNARYWILTSGVCLCGNIVNGTCCPKATDSCNGRRYLGPTIGYVTSGMSLPAIPELYVGQAYSFSVTTTLSIIDKIKWQFGASQTEVEVNGGSSTEAHTYTYSGKYDLTIKACEDASSVCDDVTLPVRVQAPRSNLTTYITAHPMHSIAEGMTDITATFRLGYDFEYYWKLTDSSSVSTYRKGCTAGWTAHRNTCLKKVTTPATFTNAKTHCTGLGATLLKINYMEEIPEIITALAGTTVQLLIGAQRSGGLWAWENDNSKTVFSNDHLTSSTNGDCAVIDGPNSALTTVDCSSTQQFACMIDPVDCPHGGELLANKHCLLLASLNSASPKTWTNAQSYCETNFDGWLANITDATVHTKATTILNDNSVSEAYIGLSDRYLSGYKTWADDTSYNADYTPTENTTTSGNCYVTQPSNTWARTDCSNIKDFFCEYSRNYERLTIPSNVVGTRDVQINSGSNVQQVMTGEAFTDTTIPTEILLFPGMWFTKSGNMRYWIVHTKNIGTGESFDIALQIYRPSCMWFTKSGNMRYWIVHTKSIGSGESFDIALQIYRPSCATGTFVMAGCENQKFGACSTTSPSCTRTTCGTNQHFCYLTKTCKYLNQSCTCYSEASTPTACSSTGTPPDYTLHAQTHATIAITGENTVMIPAGDLYVEEHDIVGIQFPTSENVVKCDDIARDVDRQTAYSASHTGWLSKNSNFPNSKTDVDTTCRLQGIYTETQTKNLPATLGYSSSVGQYALSISIIDTDERSLSVTMEEAVGDVSVIYPTIRETSTDVNNLGTVYTEYNQAYNFTVRVGMGNNLKYTFDSSAQQTFQSHCPASVQSSVSSEDLCNSSFVWSDLPYSYFTYTPTATGTSTKTITVSNSLGTTTKYLNVRTEKRISGMTFTLQSQALIANNVAINTPATFTTAFTDGTDVAYSYKVDGVDVSSNTSTLTHTFTSIGTNTVSAYLTNILGEETVDATVYVKQPAQFSSCTFIGTPYIAVIGSPISVRVQCTVETGAEVTPEFTFADDGVTHTLSTTPTTSTTETWEYQKTFTATAQNIQVTAVLKDPFENETISETVDVYNPIPSVSAAVSNNDILRGDSFTLSASVPASPGNYGDVEYNVDFGNNVNVTGTTGSFSYTYSTEGTFTINVTASNGPSVVSTTKQVSVYTAVAGLTVSNNGPNKEGDSSVITARISAGNDVSFTFTSSEFNDTQSSGTYTHTFASAGVHNVIVTCANALSSKNETETVYVLAATEIRIESLKVNGYAIPDCLESGVDHYFALSVIHYDAPSLKYNWNFDGTDIFNTTTPSKTYTYSSTGNYTLNATVMYPTESAYHSITADICIQQRLSSPLLNISNQISLPSSCTVDLTVASTFTGTPTSYTWETNMTVIGSSTSQNLKIRITSAGFYNISVTLANSINSVFVSKLVEVIEDVSSVTLHCSTCTQDSGDFYTQTGSSVDYSVQTGTGTSLSYRWDFGDGTTGSGASVTHSYSSVGSYTISVSVWNDVSVVNETVTVYVETALTSVTIQTSGFLWRNNKLNPLVKDYNIANTALFQATVSPSSMSPHYLWVYESGLTPIESTSNIGQYNYTTTGYKTVSVTAKNKVNNVTSTDFNFYVIEPITSITATELITSTTMLNTTTLFLAVYQDFSISATSSQIVNGTVSYLIRLRKGTVLTRSSLESTLNGNISSTGDYTLSIVVENSLGQKEETFNVSVLDPVTGPSIDISGTDANITLGSSIALYGGSNTGLQRTFGWTYASAPAGETLSSSLQNVTITPGSVGIYVVTLAVKNPVSSSVYVNKTIEVLQEVTGVSINSSLSPPDAVKKGSTVTFQAFAATGTDLSYAWMAVGDINPLNGQEENFTMTFGLQAYYNITLTISNPASSGSALKQVYSLNELTAVDVQVSSGATWNTNINKYVATTGADVTFTEDLSNDEFVTFDWQVNATSYGTSSSFTHNFATAGAYVVDLGVSNKISSASDEVNVVVQDGVTNFVVTGCNATYLRDTDINLSTSYSGTDVTVEWQTGTTSTGASTTVNYLDAGEHEINITASNYVSSEYRYCIITTQGTIANLQAAASVYKFVGHGITFNITGDYLDSASFTFRFSHGVTKTTATPTLTQIFSNKGNYSLTVNVSNAVSFAEVSISFSVEDLKCAEPDLRVDGTDSTERTALRARSIELAVTVSTSGCADYTSTNQWTIYEANSCTDTLANTYTLPSNILTNTPILQVPPATLPYNSYCFVYEIGYNNTPVKKYAHFNITIVESTLLALISGGDSRVANAGSTLTLDGSKSHDPDNSTGVTLAYGWSCSQTMGTASAIEVCNQINALTSASAVISGVTLTENDVYNVSLTVSASGRTSHQAAQLIDVVSGSAPVVGVECISCEANENYHISSGRKTCYAGSCTSGCDSRTTYAWTVTDRSTNTDLTIASSQTTTTTTSLNLCLNAGTLLDDKSYKFRLVATTGSQTGFAEQSLSASTKPESGSCTLSAASQVVPMTDKVNVTCQNWSDQDANTGLYYKIVASYGTDSYIVNYGTQPSTEFYLSPWPGSSYADVTVTTYVLNDHGIQVTALTETVSFKAPTLLLSQSNKVDYLVDQIIATMPTIANQNNPNLLVRYSIAALMYLNDQSENSVYSTAVRMAMRDLFAHALDGVPFTTITDVRQIASATKYLSAHPDELSKETLSKVVGNIQTLSNTLDSSVKQGHDTNAFDTDSLQETLAYLHTGLQSITSTTSDSSTLTKFGVLSSYGLDISSASTATTYNTDADMQADLVTKTINYRTQLATVQLKTLLADESEIVQTLNDGSVLKARHVTVENIPQEYSQNGVTVVIPSDILDHTEPTYTQDSVFHVTVFNSINPYNFGYNTGIGVNTKTLQTGFLDLSGTSLEVANLPNDPSDKRVQMYMFKEGVSTYSIPQIGLVNASDYAPRTGVANKSCDQLTAGEARSITVPQSSDTSSSIHVQVLPEFTTSQTDGMVNATLYRNSVQLRELAVTQPMYADNHSDHRAYTHFIPVSERISNSAFQVQFVANHDVRVCVAVYYAVCNYFNTSRSKWATNGCDPQEESIPTVASCKCDHMTSYGSGLLLSPDQIDFSDLSDLDFTNNPVAIITCSIILGLYIILVVICRKMDLLDIKHISSKPLCGKDGSFKYEVIVFTGRQLGAGTSAHVGIQLHGSYWKTAQKHIYKDGAFQRNGCDSFIIAHDVNLGEVKKIRIWHDNRGSSPSWYLDRIIINDLQTDQSYYFYCQSWLTLETVNGSIHKRIAAAGERYRTIMVLLLFLLSIMVDSRNGEYGSIHKRIAAAGSKERNRFGHRFQMAMFSSLADKHLWLSLLNRPAQSRFTRVQRATCCVTLLFTFICVNAMWYGLMKKDNQDLGWESFSWEEIILAIITNSMVLPINLALIFLFKKSRTKANLFETLQKPQTAQTIEIENDCENSQGGSFESRNTGEIPYDLDRESTLDSVPANTRGLHRSRHVSRKQRENTDDSLDRIKRPTIAMTKTSRSTPWEAETSFKWSDNDATESRPSTSSTLDPSQKPSGSKAPVGAYKKSKTVGKKESDELLAELDKYEKDMKAVENRTLRSASSRRSDTSAKSRRLTISELEGLDEILHSDDETSATNKSSKKPIPRSKGTRFNPRSDPRINGNGNNQLNSRGSATSSVNSEPEPSGSGITAGLRPAYYSDLTMESRDIRHVPIHKERCSLPAWCVYVAYVLCFLLCVFSVIIVILYCFKFGSDEALKWVLACLLSLVLSFCVVEPLKHFNKLCVFSVIIVILYCFKFGSDEALKWVLACLLSLVLSFCVVEPLKALMIALYMVAMFKNVDKNDEDDCIEIDRTIDMSHENIQEQVFEPISGFALVKATEEGRKIRRMKTIIRQFFAYMFYLWVVMVIVYVHFHYNSYLFNKYVETSFMNTTTTNYVSYNNISTIDEFWDWTENVFADTLHLQDSHTDEEHGFLLGTARMRLIRSVTEKCQASSAASSLGVSVLTDRICYGSGGFEEDTSFYGERWNESSYNKSWKYVYANELGGSDKLGYVATYSGGGYLQTLGTTYAETLTIIQDLKDKGWVDLRTRAIVFEFSFYSPGTDMTAVTALLVEFPLTGGVITSYDILSQRLLWFQENRVDPLMVMECILFLVVIYSCVHIALQIREKKVSYFKEFWHWYEMVTTLATIVSVGMYLGCVIEATNTFNNFLDDQSGFTNFERTAHLHVGTRYLYAWLLFLLMYKVVKQLRFIKFLYVFGATLSTAFGHIVGAFLIYFILLLTYAQIGYLMYGRSVAGFETVGHAVSTLVVIIRGTYNFWTMLDYQPVFSHFYLYSYYAFVYGILVALVISILNSCYKINKSKMFYKDSLDMRDYEMIDFMMSRFKLWAGIKKQKPAFRRVRFPDLPPVSSRPSTTHSSHSSASTVSTGTTGFDPDSYEPYLKRMAGRLGSTWQLFLRRLDEIEVLDQEEQKLVTKTEEVLKDLNLRCRINEFERQGKEILSWKTTSSSKPPLGDSKHRQSQRLANRDNQGQKAPSTVTGATSRASATPPGKEEKPAQSKRPLSDQGARVEQIATRRSSVPEKSLTQKFLKSVKPSKPAWNKDS